MSQVLVLGFNSFVFKQNARARIFLNNNFIDEIHIPEFINDFFLMRFKKKEEIVYNRILRNIKNNSKEIHNFDSCPTLFFYEINDAVLSKDVTIKIEIKNQDNNYSNGFMTQTTYVEFMHLYLMPKKLIDRYLKQKKIKQKDNNEIFTRKTTPVFENLTNFTYFINYKNQKTHSILYTTADNGHFTTQLHKIRRRYTPNLADQYGILTDKTITGKEARTLRDKWKHFVFDKYLQYEN